MIRKLTRWWRTRKLMRAHHCVVFCWHCRNPLNDGPQEPHGIDDVKYTCRECGAWSVFSFGGAPVPILLEYGK